MSSGNYAVTIGEGGTSAQPRFRSGTSLDQVSEREQLSNFISIITREETPFYSRIGSTKAEGVYHEWQTDELAEPRNSRVVQGSDFASVRPDGDNVNDNADSSSVDRDEETPRRVRLGNYTQINAKTIAVSGTKRAADQAGVADEYAYQLKKRGTELRRDIERDLIHSINTSAGGSDTVAGRSASVLAWATNIIDKADASSGTATIWVPPVAANRGDGRTAWTQDTTGTFGELELEDVDSSLQTIYEEGGKATRLHVSPYNRRVFSQKAQASNGANASSVDGNVRRNIDDSGKLTQAVSIYMSDFGEIMVEPNYVLGLSNTDNNDDSALTADTQNRFAFVYDPSWFKIATYRPFQEVDVGQRGDSTVGQLIEEWSLEVTNPKGWGIIANIGA